MDQFQEPEKYVIVRSPEPWGLWATIGFSLIIIIGFFLIQTLCLMLYLVVAVSIDPGTDIRKLSENIEFNGLLVIVATTITSVFIIALTLLFAWLKKGITLKEYFCFYKVNPQKVIQWLGVFLLFIICSDSIVYLSGRDIVPEWSVRIYQSAVFPPLMWLALIVFSPIYEELVFRGFIFKGIQHSKAGPVWAILLTSFVWASIHIQYDAFFISVIFSAGLLLGYVRWKSNSIALPILLHSTMNLLATIETVIYIKYFLK